MRKLMKIICFAAILCVAYLVLATPRAEAEPVIKPIDAVTHADEAIGDVVKKADEVLEDAVEQADKALADAVDSAAEGAKQGFFESLKESAREFWEELFP